MSFARTLGQPRVTTATKRGDGFGFGGDVGLLPLVVPRRRASLRTRFAQRGGLKEAAAGEPRRGCGGGGGGGEEGEDESEVEQREHDRARKIWTEIRRMSSVGSGGGGEEEKDRRASGSSTVAEEEDGVSRSEVERRREVIRERALRNRRSVGADTLKSLVPTEAGTNTYAQAGDRETTPKRAVASSKIGSLNGRGKGKENMRWSWTGWWQ